MQIRTIATLSFLLAALTASMAVTHEMPSPIKAAAPSAPRVMALDDGDEDGVFIEGRRLTYLS